MINRIVKRIFKANQIEPKVNQDNSWENEYASYEEAKQFCQGYEAAHILEKVSDSLLKVKNGEAVYERDSVLFDELQHNWALIAILEKIAIEKNLRLNVVDFGGSLGSTFFYVKKIMPLQILLKWSIIEQQHYVDTGRKLFESEQLNFYYDLNDFKKKSPEQEVLLLSGVLQYLPESDNILQQLQSYGFDYIIVDRTSFVQDEQEFWTIQKVPESIYKAEYPCKFFNKEKFIQRLSQYQVEHVFDAVYDANRTINGKNCVWEGMLFKKRN